MRKKQYIEFFGAYDGVLCWKYDGEDTLYHRVDNSEVLESFQVEEFGPVYFHTSTGFFRNIFEISKEEFLFNKKKKLGKQEKKK